MNYSILTKGTLHVMTVGLISTLTLLCFNQARAEDSTHGTAYTEALQRLLAAQDSLLDEMRRIQGGGVAHFDFLQHAHIELLRDARALRYPPAGLNATQRAALREQAEQVLQLASAMEWTLADFLRSHAQISGALSSTVDLAQLASAGAADSTQAALSRLSKAADNFRRQPNSQALTALLRSFDRTVNLPLNPQYREELALQRHLLTANVEPRQGAIDEIGASGLNLAAAQLLALYEHSLQLLSAHL